MSRKHVRWIRTYTGEGRLRKVAAQAGYRRRQSALVAEIESAEVTPERDSESGRRTIAAARGHRRAHSSAEEAVIDFTMSTIAAF